MTLAHIAVRVPKQDQTLEEVESLLLEQLEIIKSGEFDEWIIPAIINDFLKSEKASLEFNTARVSMMRQAFIEGAQWDYHIAEIDRMEQLTKQDVVDVANKYFGDDYVAVYRVDAQHVVPEVEKPQIDPVTIDPTRQSEFASKILTMQVEEIEPTFVEMDSDYRIIEFAPGLICTMRQIRSMTVLILRFCRCWNGSRQATRTGGRIDGCCRH